LPTYHNRDRRWATVLLSISTIVLADGILEISSRINYIPAFFGHLQRTARGFKRHNL